MGRKKYSAEFKEQAVRRVIDGPRPIVDVARELGMHEGTLANWVHRYRDEHPVEEKPLSQSERARLAELERENRELRMKTEFLGKASMPGAGTAGACNRGGAACRRRCRLVLPSPRKSMTVGFVGDC